MALFSMTTVDNALTWSPNQAGQVVYVPETNNQSSDTQGFLRKSQKGKIRYRAIVRIECTESAYTNTISEMLVYPTDVNATFERNIPKRNTNTGRFTFERMPFSEDVLQFDSEGSANTKTAEITMEFVEVLF
jgi:hypothetical protein